MTSRRTLIFTLAISLAACVASPTRAAEGGGVIADPGAAEGKHFHPKGKLPSTFTIELRKGVRATLPFEDERDFAEAKKGFIAEPPYQQIMADAGHVAWDMASYQFLLQGKDFESVHPSLQRQAVLNMALRPLRGRCPTRSTRCAATTWPTSASSRATPAGSSSIR